MIKKAEDLDHPFGGREYAKNEKQPCASDFPRIPSRRTNGQHSLTVFSEP